MDLTSWVYKSARRVRSRGACGVLMERDNPNKELALNGLSGAAGGLVSRSITSPFSVLKTTNQVSLGGTIRMWNVPAALRQLVAAEGLEGLWKGNLVACARIVPYTGVKFMAYHRMMSYLSNDTFIQDGIREVRGRRHHPNGGAQFRSKARRRFDMAKKRAFAGSIAGLASVLATFPLDVLKVRLTVAAPSEAESRDYINIARATARMRSEEGLAGFYRGIGTTLAGVMVYSGLQFAAYETLKHFWARGLAAQYDESVTTIGDIAGVQQLQQLKFYHHMVLGAVSGGGARFIAYPFDVVRKRLMIQTRDSRILPRGAEAGYHGVACYSSALDCARRIAVNEGMLAFWKGRGVNILMVLPSSAITFAVYEETRRFLVSMGGRMASGGAVFR